MPSLFSTKKHISDFIYSWAEAGNEHIRETTQHLINGGFLPVIKILDRRRKIESGYLMRQEEGETSCLPFLFALFESEDQTALASAFTSEM